MYIRLNRQPNAILLVEFHEKPNNKCEIDYSYYFLWVKPASIEDDPKDDTVQADIPKVYLKVSIFFVLTNLVLEVCLLLETVSQLK